MLSTLSKFFLDFTTKLKSPDFILPGKKFYDKEVLIESLSQVTKKLFDLSKNLDLASTATAFPFPGLGELTRLEIFHFIISHTKRHLHQLQKIKEAFIELWIIFTRDDLLDSPSATTEFACINGVTN